jgi:hypothetical protein
MLQNLHYEVEIILSPTIAPVYMAAQNVIIPVANMTTIYLYNTDYTSIYNTVYNNAYNTITNYGYNIIRFISQYLE